jgi:hypothetical protein
MSFPTVAAVDASLKRARANHYRILVVDTPPGMGVITELTARSRADGFVLMDLTDVPIRSGTTDTDGMIEAAQVQISSFKDKDRLLVLCVRATPSQDVQKIVAHAASEFGSAVGYASLNSLYVLASQHKMGAVRPAAIDPSRRPSAPADESAPSVRSPAP